MQLLRSVDGIITSGLHSNREDSVPVRLIPPYRRELSFFIKSHEAGKPLAQVLAARFPYKAPDFWESRIQAGHILTSGTALSSREGDRVVHLRSDVVEPSVPDLVSCVTRGEDWSVWFKPAPLPMHSGGRYHKNTFLEIAKELHGGDLYPVHRLDAVTTGLVLAGHSPEAGARLGQFFAGRFVKKVYLAIVAGSPGFEGFWTVNQPVRRKKGFVFELHPDGQPAETRFTVMSRGTDRSLIACIPITGRTHQIRLHLRYAGIPVIDDPVYGAGISEPDDRTLQNVPIRLLHAAFDIQEAGIRVLLPGFHDVASALL